MAQTPLSVTVSTSQAQYTPTQTVLISGTVRDSLNNPVLGAGASIQVNGPGGTVHVQLVYTNQAGSYSDSFILAADSVAGQYTVYVVARKTGYADGQGQLQFTVQGGGTVTSSTSQTTSSTGPSQRLCLIATAAYGSELSPEVALLRTFRDKQVLNTRAGSSFMQAFNAFYYSFSPQVASHIAANTILRLTAKMFLYPLVGVLYLASAIFQVASSNSEGAIILSGMFASFALGLVYLGPIAAVIARLASGRSSRYTRALRAFGALAGCSLIGLVFADVIQLTAILTITTVGLVLSCMGLGALLLPGVTARRTKQLPARLL